MTTNLAREAFRIVCDKRSIGAYDTFLTSEIDYFFSFAIRQFYERRLSGFTKDRTSFEEWQKRSEDLRPVYGLFTKTNPAIDTKKGCKHASIDLPPEDTLWHVLSEECTFIKRTSGQEVVSDVYECTTDTLNARISNSLGDHVYHANRVRPLRLFTFKDIPGSTERTMVSELYFIDANDALSSIKSYSVEYIKQPGAFGTMITGWNEATDAGEQIFQVPAYAWDEIVSIAASAALENSSSPRVNTYSMEQQLIQ